MKNSILLINLTVLLSTSCGSPDNSSNPSLQTNKSVPVMDSGPVLIKDLVLEKTQIDSLETIALDNGDKNAFYTVEAFYEMRKEEHKMLTFCIRMAHKHNYNFAYFMVYTVLVHQTDNNLKALDEQSQNLALYYLTRSYELGYKEALYIIEEEFGKNKPIQKSSYYLNKMAEYDESSKRE